MISKAAFCLHIFRRHGILIDYDGETPSKIPFRDLDYSDNMTFGQWKKTYLGESIGNVTVYAPKQGIAPQKRMSDLRNDVNYVHFLDIRTEMILRNNRSTQAAENINDHNLMKEVMIYTQKNEGRLERPTINFIEKLNVLAKTLASPLRVIISMIEAHDELEKSRKKNISKNHLVEMIDELRDSLEPSVAELFDRVIKEHNESDANRIIFRQLVLAHNNAIRKLRNISNSTTQGNRNGQ